MTLLTSTSSAVICRVLCIAWGRIEGLVIFFSDSSVPHEVRRCRRSSAEGSSTDIRGRVPMERVKGSHGIIFCTVKLCSPTPPEIRS